MNNEYCEHLSNITKYIETTRIYSLNLTSAGTGEHFAVVGEGNERSTSDLEPQSSNVDPSAAPLRIIRSNSLHLNGFKIHRVEFRYYISEINEDVLREHFPHNHIQVGDEVIKVNNEYCEHLSNITKYIETTRIQSLNLMSVTTREYYTEIMAASIATTPQSSCVSTKGMYMQYINHCRNTFINCR